MEAGTQAGLPRHQLLGEHSVWGDGGALAKVPQAGCSSLPTQCTVACGAHASLNEQTCSHGRVVTGP